MSDQSNIVLDLESVINAAERAGWSESTLRQISRVLQSGVPDNRQIAEINAIMQASGDFG